jgi:hypothetical protein
MEQAKTQQPQFKCKQCGFQEAKPQLREVMITVGWVHSQFKSASPCLMCLQCGDLSCPIELNIGKYLNFVPGNSPPPSGGESVPMSAPPPELRAVRPQLLEEPAGSSEQAAQ